MYIDSNKNKIHKISKLVAILAILTLLSYVFLNYKYENRVYASQTREIYSENKIKNYLGYKDLIENLKRNHPNWKFTIFYTGLDWNQVIKNEGAAYHGRNVVPASWSDSWRCSICGDTPRAGSSWRCASEAAISYYMDPRNWLNDNYIFQFENLAYNEETQTLEGVQKIIADVKYMQGGSVTYTKTDGTKATLNKSYAQIIMEAAKEAKISPYHLASRIRQEQGTGTQPGTLATGTYSGYVGYYNFLNIKASGNTDSQVIANGLNYAKLVDGKKGKVAWTDPEISIKAGAKVLASNYINDGQDTLYLQKFDVDNSDGTLYYFQYMQNVAAAASESTKVRKAYQELNLLNSSIEFVIPVYENMPEIVCAEPGNGTIVTQNIKVTGSNVAIRQTPNGNKITEVNTGDILLRIEAASSSVNGYYWDKVVLPDGRQGYMVRNYIMQIPDISNCNESVIANTSVNLRNGPGLNGTTIVTTLIKGQALTRIETGKYNIDGYIWDRVKLADGRQGYIAQKYIDKSATVTASTDLVKVICTSGLKVREQPGTGQKVLTYVNKNDILTRVQAATSTANGYIWDKIVTSDGIEGYIARGDSKEQYIEVVGTQNLNLTTTTNPTTTTSKNENFKLEETNLVCEPATTIESIKEKYTDKTITIKNADGTLVTTGNIGTGYTITIEGKNYTVVKMGDISGDGLIDARDSLRILKYSVGGYNISGDFKTAADINKDGVVDARDSLRILKYVVGTFEINI